MAQNRSLKAFALRLAGVAALIGLVHVGARITRFLSLPPETTWCFGGYVDTEYSSSYYLTECTLPHSFWAALRSYTPRSVEEAVMHHVIGFVLVAGAVAALLVLYAIGRFIVTGEWPDSKEEESSQQCVHTTDDEAETALYCRNSECPCVEHEDEEFAAVWIPRQN